MTPAIGFLMFFSLLFIAPQKLLANDIKERDILDTPGLSQKLSLNSLAYNYDFGFGLGGSKNSFTSTAYMKVKQDHNFYSPQLEISYYEFTENEFKQKFSLEYMLLSQLNLVKIVEPFLGGGLGLQNISKQMRDQKKSSNIKDGYIFANIGIRVRFAKKFLIRFQNKSILSLRAVQEAKQADSKDKGQSIAQHFSFDFITEI